MQKPKHPYSPTQCSMHVVSCMGNRKDSQQLGWGGKDTCRKNRRPLAPGVARPYGTGPSQGGGGNSEAAGSQAGATYQVVGVGPFQGEATGPMKI